MMGWEAREVWIETGAPGVPESGPIDLTGWGFGPKQSSAHCYATPRLLASELRLGDLAIVVSGTSNEGLYLVALADSR